VTNDEGKIAESRQIAQGRGIIYQLLARCFYAPTRELLVDVMRGPSAPVMQNLLTTFKVSALEEMLALEKNGVAGRDVETNEDQAEDLLLQSLKAEYVRLFEGPGHMQVAPYESVHRKDVSEMEKGLVMGPATIDARRRYAEAGVAIAKDFKDLPDHIAVELEFMYYLCARQAETVGSEMEAKFAQAQREFLKEHFMKWLPDFNGAVVRAAHVQFYRDLARATQAFIASEAAELLEPYATH
jgi:DMSO reductase family type II enzyme chaperone